MTETEADTCRKFVVPKLREAGWDDVPHAINEHTRQGVGDISPTI